MHINLGNTYRDLGDAATALKCFERALELEPGNYQAGHSRGTALLALGEFASGWAGYENRLRCEQYDTRDFPQPRWDGGPFEGRTILVHSEQGFGDTLQFIRYVSLVSKLGGNAFVGVQPPLMSLLRVSGVRNLIAVEGPYPPFDFHVPLMSLPHVMGTRLESVSCDVPYLAIEPERIERWRERLHKHAGFRVGLVWQGRTSYARDCLRSIPLTAFRPLADVPDVQLISLQQGPGSEQLAALAAQDAGTRFAVIDPELQLEPDGSVFLDAAAVMKNLDLVIACDTGLAHLAGGLGVPVWVALSLGSEWRWMQQRDDSPWYPTMRLFRQTTFRDWDGVFQRMAAALAQRVEGWRSQAAGGTL